MVLYQCMHLFLVLSSAAVSWCVVAFCVLGALLASRFFARVGTFGECGFSVADFGMRALADGVSFAVADFGVGAPAVCGLCVGAFASAAVVLLSAWRLGWEVLELVFQRCGWR